jgi:hypothetical protein
MKRFIVTVLCFCTIPVLLLVVVFCITDPYRTIHKFNPSNSYDDLREYVSTELFLRNNSKQHYNAFIFANSKAAAISTYLWKSLIGDNVRPFLFQAWSEDIEGIQQKVDFVNYSGNELDYVLILIDPSSFPAVPNRNDLIHLRHPLLSGQSKIGFEIDVFKNYIQKPSQWVRSILLFVEGDKTPLVCDTITNDVFGYYADIWDEELQQDSLKGCTQITRESFIEDVSHLGDADIEIGEPIITAYYESLLRHIKAIFDTQQSQYKILIMPSYIYKSKLFNVKDLSLLNEIFGEKNVYNYFQKNEYTTDYNYYIDPGHPGLLAGSMILREIYNTSNTTQQ